MTLQDSTGRESPLGCWMPTSGLGAGPGWHWVSLPLPCCCIRAGARAPRRARNEIESSKLVYYAPPVDGSILGAASRWLTVRSRCAGLDSWQEFETRPPWGAIEAGPGDDVRPRMQFGAVRLETSSHLKRTTRPVSFSPPASTRQENGRCVDHNPPRPRPLDPEPLGATIELDPGGSSRYALTQQRRPRWYGDISGNSYEGPGADAGPFLHSGGTMRCPTV